MRILHTADWHLADRLKHIDRTPDLRRAVERVTQYVRDERADVLVVAGDLFSELARPDTFQASIEHLSEVFRPFLLGGGTMVAVTGNHDSEIFCQTLRRAFQLAAPLQARPGDLLPPGRLYLAPRPTHFRLADRLGKQVQFACLPYPSTAGYLRDGSRRYDSFDQQRCALRDAYRAKLRSLAARLDPHLPRVLVSHVAVHGPFSTTPLRLVDSQDIVIEPEPFMDGWSYVALGHVHQPQSLKHWRHVRYSGSIERLSLRERHDSKGVVLVETHAADEAVEVAFLPLDATPFYDVQIKRPKQDLPGLRSRYRDADRALVRCHVTYRPGEDNLHVILGELSRIFPRCYQRTWAALGSSYAGGRQAWHASPGSHATDIVAEMAEAGGSVAETVMRYLEHQLAEDDPDREELLELARRILE